MLPNITGGLQWTTAIYRNKNGTDAKVSADGYYTICNATAKIYDVAAHATSNDTWEKASMVKNLDSRLVFTSGDIQQNGTLIPNLETKCTNCEFIGAENGNLTMALAFAGKVRALLFLLGGFANVGVDGKGYPLPSDIWLGNNYSRFFVNSSDDAAQITNRFQNRFMVALSEVNKVSDGMKVELQVEEKYTCVVNRWPVIYSLLVLSGLIGLIGCYYILSMKSKFIDIGPRSLLAIGTTYETQQSLRSTKVLGEKNMDIFNSRNLCLVNVDHQNVAL
ncbi:12963_t:CDS:1, partial [Racocetra fulgida]